MSEKTELTDDEREQVEHLVEIEEDVGTICSAVKELNAAQLHEFCCNYNWDGDLCPLHVALEQSHCEYASALVIYWLSEPDAWAGRDSVEEYEQKTFDVFKNR